MLRLFGISGLCGLHDVSGFQLFLLKNQRLMAAGPLIYKCWSHARRRCFSEVLQTLEFAHFVSLHRRRVELFCVHSSEMMELVFK